MSTSTMKTGAFLMMDALGFKALSRQNPKDLRDKLHGLVKELNWVDDLGKSLKSHGHSEVPQLTFLSDTIVVGMPNIIDPKLQKTDLEYSVHSLSLAAVLANNITSVAGRGPMPIAYRGCISFGEYEMDERFILGPAVNDAAEHYEMGESAAVWLTPTALAIWTKGSPEPDAPTPRSLHPYAVPLKTGGSFETVAANPFYHDFHTASQADRQVWTQSLLSSFTGPISVHVKRQNTEKLLAAFEAEAAKWPRLPWSPSGASAAVTESQP